MVSLSKPYQLLIADDDREFRETLRAILDPYFCTVEVSSGEEAIEITEHERFDIALLDMHMHRMTGLETLRVLKSINAVAPCILITADASEDLKRSAWEADAYSVLEKPITKSELVTTVSTAFEDVYEDPDVFLPGRI